MILRFACALLIAALAGPVSAREVASGAMYLTTLPTGADVWVDGAYVGRTPVLVDGLTAGKHTVTAAKTGWDSHEVDVAVGLKPAFQFVDFQLARSARAPRANGKLAVRSSVPVDSIAIDGIPVMLNAGATLDLAPGPHEITLRTARGKTVRRVLVYAETITNLVLREPVDDDARAAVVAPAASYLSPADILIEGSRLVIRHNGHSVTGTLGSDAMLVDGSAVRFASAPTLVGGKLYLPLELYVRIGAVPLNSR